MKFGLCLGAGGIRGMCHVGALEVLEENGIIPDMISGSSMGAVIGGMYAAGVSIEAMREKLTNIKQFDLMDINPIALRHNGLLSGNKSAKILRTLSDDKNIEDCKIDFIACAVDVISGKTVYLDKGSLWEAVKASYAVPGFFAGVDYGDMLLVDGGVKERMPINILYERGCDIVLAINPCGELLPINRPRTIMGHVARAFEIMDWELAKTTLSKADLTITMDRGAEVNYYKASESGKAYEIGKEQMSKNIKNIKKLLKARR